MTLDVRPTIDGDTVAARWQRLLLLPYEIAGAIAEQTVKALAAGEFRTADGSTVHLGPAVSAAVRAKVSVPPDAPLPPAHPPRFATTTVTIANESTLAAAAALHGEGRRPLVLNMANGVTPGGGFRHGARAQEEYLCRSSALWAALDRDPMYDAHRARHDYESSDWAILSPDVPVVRDDAGHLLAQPWPCAFISCAAPVAHRVGQPRSARLMDARINRVLAIAAAHGYPDLVLGAWGCGAFSNDPHRTAASFRQSLAGPFAGHFDRVVFAITDWSAQRLFLGPFRDAFGAPPAAPAGSAAP